MSFWKNLFGGKSLPKELSATNNSTSRTISLIDKKLSVSIFLHKIIVHKQTITCLSYLTNGLKELGQQELLITFKNSSQKYDAYEPVLIFFKQIYLLAQNGSIVKNGDYSQFGERDLIGWKGVLYTKIPNHINSLDQQIPTGCLAMILLTLEEVKSIQQFGHMRILSMLGKNNRWYPFPYWSDLDRKGLPIDELQKQSILKKVQSSIKISPSTITYKETKIFLTIPKTLKLQSLPSDIYSSDLTISLFPDLDSKADGCLTWSFEHNITDAIIPDKSEGKNLSGCFIVLIPAQNSNTSRLLEDGFVIMLTRETWKRFWKAVIDKEDILIECENSSPDLQISHI